MRREEAVVARARRMDMPMRFNPLARRLGAAVPAKDVAQIAGRLVLEEIANTEAQLRRPLASRCSRIAKPIRGFVGCKTTAAPSSLKESLAATLGRVSPVELETPSQRSSLEFQPHHGHKSRVGTAQSTQRRDVEMRQDSCSEQLIVIAQPSAKVETVAAHISGAN